MQKIILVLIVLFSSQLFAFQSMDGRLIDNDDFIGFTIEPSFGYLYGQSREIVYLNGSSDAYLSELIWDLKDILYIGSSASINFKNRLYLNLGLWTAINPGTGQMMDFDWLNLLGYSYDVHDDYGKLGWTNWSLSSVEIIQSLFFDLNLAYDFLHNRKFNFSFILGFKSLYWDWTDSVLDSLYPSGPDVIEVGVNGIDYQLALDIPYLGIGGAYYNDKLYIQGRFHYSPFVIGKDHDHHILTSTHYYDNIYFGQYLSATIKFAYIFNSIFSLSTSITGDYLFERRGDTFVYNESGVKTGTYPGGAGIQYQTISFSINGAFSF